MKAIKLASVFAVSAVAAAVSTTTLAAEPVFKGTAGLSYKSVDNGTDTAGSEGEVNIIGDTGVVYFDLDMEGDTTGSDGGFDLDEIYVKQGAVQFGDFDGSMGDDAAFSAGVEEDNDGAKEDLGTGLGIRYAVSDELTVALEVAEGENKGAIAFNYATDVSGVTLGVSGGANSDEHILTLGASVPAGIATISAFYQTGSRVDTATTDKDVSNYGLGLDLALTEELSAAVQYYTLDGEASAGVDLKDQGITEGTVNYQVGDIRYYATYVDYEDDATADYSVVGAEVSF
ncbi:hypothetical protein [Marinomonas epiphytica]